jgi:hypothetical protein
MEKPSAISLEKLSQLQKSVLVMLLEKRYELLGRAAFRDLVKKLYWGHAHLKANGHACSVSLSRAIASLEARGFIVRAAHSGWRLTYPLVTGSLGDLVNNGEMFAILAWKEKKDLYAQVGLRGPSRESLGFSQPAQAPKRKGVEVELSL